MLVGSMKCNRGQLYAAKMWAWIGNLFEQGNQCLLKMKWNEMSRALGHLCAHIG